MERKKKSELIAIIKTYEDKLKIQEDKLKIKEDELEKYKEKEKKETELIKEKERKTEEEKIKNETSTIFFYRNNMLKNIDDNTLKYGICDNFEEGKTGKEFHNKFYIDDIENIRIIRIKRENKKDMKEVIIKLLKEYTIYENDISTAIIDDENLNKKIEEIKESENKIKDILKKKDEKMLNFSFKELKGYKVLEKIKTEYLSKFIENITRGEGKLICYRYKEYDYYDKDLWSFEILSKTNDIPKSNYVNMSFEKSYEHKTISENGNKKLISLILLMNMRNKNGFYKNDSDIIYFVTTQEEHIKINEDIKVVTKKAEGLTKKSKWLNTLKEHYKVNGDDEIIIIGDRFLE